MLWYPNALVPREGERCLSSAVSAALPRDNGERTSSVERARGELREVLHGAEAGAPTPEDQTPRADEAGFPEKRLRSAHRPYRKVRAHLELVALSAKEERLERSNVRDDGAEHAAGQVPAARYDLERELLKAELRRWYQKR